MEQKYNQLNTQKFIERSQAVHGDYYDYSLVDYKMQYDPVKIICPVHGEFEQLPKTHMKGAGCKKCGIEKLSKSLTMKIEDFIKKANQVHNNKYTYDKVDYVKSIEKVIMTCPNHGDFMQSPNNHLRGAGCPKCAIEKQSERLKTPVNIFIDKAQKVHDNKYDYSEVQYNKSNLKVAIKCNKHGVFYQTPNAHLRGQGCPICGEELKALNRRLTTDEIIKRARQVHGDTYDYSKTVYEKGEIPIKIICKKHGEFLQSAYNHIGNEQGCPICGIEKRSISQRGTTEDFVQSSIKTHGDRYDYSLSEYGQSNKDLIIIICKIHGPFKQTPISHINGQGCPVCANNIKKTTEDFIEDAKEIHGNEYDYSLVDYKGGKERVSVICPKHGTFDTLPVNHLRGSGCPSCNESRGEKMISLFLEDNNVVFERQKKFDGCFRFSDKKKRCYKLPFDFYLPTYNSIIEYDGIQHFKPISIFGGIKAYEKQVLSDKLKNAFCEKNNISILRIPYTASSEEVKNLIKTFLSLK